MSDLLVEFDYAQTLPTEMRFDCSFADLSFDPVSSKKTNHALWAAELLRDKKTQLVYKLGCISGR